MTFENEEVQNVELFNFGKILRVTRKVIKQDVKIGQFLQYFFQSQPETEIKTDYYFLDFETDSPDGAKVPHTRLLECKPSLKYQSDFFSEIAIF